MTSVHCTVAVPCAKTPWLHIWRLQSNLAMICAGLAAAAAVALRAESARASSSICCPVCAVCLSETHASRSGAGIRYASLHGALSCLSPLVLGHICSHAPHLTCEVLSRIWTCGSRHAMRDVTSCLLQRHTLSSYTEHNAPPFAASHRMCRLCVDEYQLIHATLV